MRLAEYYIHLGVTYAAVAMCLWAFIDALTRPSAAFGALEKLSKPAWVAILAVCGVVLWFFGFVSFFGLPAMVATGVYLADVRPAIRELLQGGQRW